MSGWIPPTPEQVDNFGPRERQALLRAALVEVRAIREELAEIRADWEARR